MGTVKITVTWTEEVDYESEIEIGDDAQRDALLVGYDTSEDWQLANYVGAHVLHPEHGAETARHRRLLRVKKIQREQLGATCRTS